MLWNKCGRKEGRCCRDLFVIIKITTYTQLLTHNAHDIKEIKTVLIQKHDIMT